MGAVITQTRGTLTVEKNGQIKTKNLLGFSLSFVPLATIIGFLYKGSYYLGVSLLFRSGFFVTLMMVIFVAILSALINAFSGFMTMYIYNQIEPQPEETLTSIDIQE